MGDLTQSESSPFDLVFEIWEQKGEPPHPSFRVKDDIYVDPVPPSPTPSVQSNNLGA